MHRIKEEIKIDAPVDKVWELLADFSSYSEWNPFLTDIEGDIQEGARLKVTISLPNARPVVFLPRIREVIPGRKLRWIGRIWVPKLFDGDHSFELEPSGSTHTRFVQKESFDGILVNTLWNSIAADTHEGFRRMNSALKERAER